MAQKPRSVRDPVSLAKLIGDIATGQTTDAVEDHKDPKAVARGKAGGIKGGTSRMGAMTPEARRKFATDAANKRWGKVKKS